MVEDAKGAGWIFLAATLMLVAGVLNAIWGFAAIAGSSFFVEDQRFILAGLNTMGWLILAVAVIQLVAAFSIYAGGEFGRFVGIFAASLAAIGALLSIPGYPLWSVCVFFLDVMIVYNLAAYGGQASRHAAGSQDGVAYQQVADGRHQQVAR